MTRDCGHPRAQVISYAFFSLLFSLLLFWECVLIFSFWDPAESTVFFSSCSQTSVSKHSLSLGPFWEPLWSPRPPVTPGPPGGQAPWLWPLCRWWALFFWDPCRPLFWIIMLLQICSVGICATCETKWGRGKVPPSTFLRLANWRNILNHLKSTVSFKCSWRIFCYQLCTGIPKLKWF